MGVETRSSQPIEQPEGIAGKRLKGELMLFAHLKAPDPEELHVLEKFGKAYVVNHGDNGTLEAVAVRGKGVVTGEPDVTMIESEKRIVVLIPKDPDGPSRVQYDAASKPGSRKIFFNVEDGDVTAIFSAHSAELGAKVLCDSTQDPEAAATVRQKILEQLAEQAETNAEPTIAALHPFFNNVESRPINDFRDPHMDVVYSASPKKSEEKQRQMYVGEDLSVEDLEKLFGNSR